MVLTATHTTGSRHSAMSDSIQGPSEGPPNTPSASTSTPTSTSTSAPAYLPRRTRPGEAMKVLTRRVEYLNSRIRQRLALGNANDVGYDEAERDAVLWALDTIQHLCRRLLGPLKDARVVCDRCSVVLETRVTVNGELRVVGCHRCSNVVSRHS